MSEQQPPTADAAQLLLAQFVELLADALARRLADTLGDRPPTVAELVPSRRLLTLDELVALLPAGKKPKTWKAWLYERTRHGQVPGCHRLGGRLFFNPDQILPWLTSPDLAKERPHSAGEGGQGLDSPAIQSNHRRPMPESSDKPAGGR